jgi:hypothetical protein
MAPGCDIKDTPSLACHASAQPQLCLATGEGICASCCADGTQEKPARTPSSTDPGAPSSESDGGTGAPRRLGVTCHVIHDGQTRLPGWAYRTRTGESVRALSDWICLATSSQVARAGRRRSFACKLRQWICSTRLWSRISNIRVVDQRDLVRSRMRPVRRSNSRVLVNVTRSDRVRFGIHLNLLCLHSTTAGR